MAINDDYQNHNQEAHRAFNAGMAFNDLLDQLERLRRAPPDMVPFSWAPGDVFGSLVDEFEELNQSWNQDPLADETKNDSVMGEARDLLSCILQLFIVSGHDPVDALKLASAKLRSRLDRVDAGLRWEDAKREEQGTDSSSGVSSAIPVGPPGSRFSAATTDPLGCDHVLRADLCGYVCSDGEELDVVDLCLCCHSVRVWGCGWMVPPPPDDETASVVSSLLADGDPCVGCGMFGASNGCTTTGCANNPYESDTTDP
jgi:hypothetical protein